jgi:hypothetical protein
MLPGGFFVAVHTDRADNKLLERLSVELGSPSENIVFAIRAKSGVAIPKSE